MSLAKALEPRSYPGVSPRVPPRETRCLRCRARAPTALYGSDNLPPSTDPRVYNWLRGPDASPVLALAEPPLFSMLRHLAVYHRHFTDTGLNLSGERARGTTSILTQSRLSDCTVGYSSGFALRLPERSLGRPDSTPSLRQAPVTTE